MKNKVIHSNDPDVDTMKCPKCGAIWRSLSDFDYDRGGLIHEEENCPSGCHTKLFKNPVRGVVIPRD